MMSENESPYFRSREDDNIYRQERRPAGILRVRPRTNPVVRATLPFKDFHAKIHTLQTKETRLIYEEYTDSDG